MFVLARSSLLALVLLSIPLAGCGGSAEATGRGATSPQAMPSGTEERGGASYYADKLAGRPTASGEPYEPAALTAAHRTLPLGTIVLVTRVKSGRSVEVRINDRGPHARGRIVDLSRKAAEAIDLVRDGVADVVLRVISLPPEKKSKKKARR